MGGADFFMSAASLSHDIAQAVALDAGLWLDQRLGAALCAAALLGFTNNHLISPCQKNVIYKLNMERRRDESVRNTRCMFGRYFELFNF